MKKSLIAIAAVLLILSACKKDKPVTEPAESNPCLEALNYMNFKSRAAIVNQLWTGDAGNGYTLINKSNGDELQAYVYFNHVPKNGEKYTVYSFTDFNAKFDDAALSGAMYVNDKNSKFYSTSAGDQGTITALNDTTFELCLNRVDLAPMASATANSDITLHFKSVLPKN